MAPTQNPVSILAVAEIPKTAVRHAACGSWWSGINRAHCAACCRTFSGDSAAEKHRVGTPGVDRHCADPATVGLVAREMPYGILWGWPGPEGDAAAKLAELRSAA